MKLLISQSITPTPKMTIKIVKIGIMLDFRFLTLSHKGQGQTLEISYIFLKKIYIFHRLRA